MSFKDIISNPKILKAIEEAGYTAPTPIQMQAIPKILEGCDILGSAQTGTGKTAAFILPTLNKLSQDQKPGRGPRVLVLVPTRELAMQVAAETAKYSKHLAKMKTVCVYGGTPYPLQIKDLNGPYEILVATPGRLIDHMERGRINFSRLELMILDEADRMLDMGFIAPVEQIAEATPKSRQTLLFSATLKGSVLNLAKRLLKNPVEITVHSDTEKHENIEQRLHNVDNINHKYDILDHLLGDEAMSQTIVFTSTKRQADVLVERLAELGHETAALHGDLNQRQRTRTIMRMRKQEIKVLVATDVAARGIDVQSISHVINFDLPQSAEDYVHRIGRTGRAGATGVALSFAASKDMHIIRQIEKFTGQKMTAHTIPGLEPKLKSSSKPMPPRRFTPRPGAGNNSQFKRRFKPNNR